jgi:hypothetical protein
MGEGTITIDLGEIAPAGAPDELLPQPSERVRRRRWRGITAVLAGVLCFGLTAAGASPAALTGGFTVPIEWAWFWHADNAVYVVSGRQEVTAHSIDDGHVLWRTTVPHEVNHMTMVGDGPIAVHEQGNCSEQSRLNPVTGKIDWTRVGMLVGDQPTDGTVRIIHDLEGGCADPSSSASEDQGAVDLSTLPQALDVVDLETGVARLTMSIKAGQQWTLGPRGASIAFWDQKGHLEERDLATGATLVTGDVPALADPVGTLSSMTPSVWGFDDVWVVIDPPSLMADDTDAVVSAYTRSTLAPRWSVRMPAPGADVHQYFGLWECEDSTICVQLGDSQSVGLDLATGARRPGLPEDPGISVGQRWRIVSDPSPVSNQSINAVLWDLRTDRNAFPTWTVQTFNPPMASKVVLSQSVGPDTEFAIFDASTGRMRRLGATPGGFAGCDLTPRSLLCVDGHSVLHVWPVRG